MKLKHDIDLRIQDENGNIISDVFKGYIEEQLPKILDNSKIKIFDTIKIPLLPWQKKDMSSTALFGFITSTEVKLNHAYHELLALEDTMKKKQIAAIPLTEPEEIADNVAHELKKDSGYVAPSHTLITPEVIRAGNIDELELAALQVKYYFAQYALKDGQLHYQDVIAEPILEKYDLYHPDDLVVQKTIHSVSLHHKELLLQYLLYGKKDEVYYNELRKTVENTA